LAPSATLIAIFPLACLAKWKERAANTAPFVRSTMNTVDVASFVPGATAWTIALSLRTCTTARSYA
jgi:hypothetical protein